MSAQRPGRRLRRLPGYPESSEGNLYSLGLSHFRSFLARTAKQTRSLDMEHFVAFLLAVFCAWLAAPEGENDIVSMFCGIGMAEAAPLPRIAGVRSPGSVENHANA